MFVISPAGGGQARRRALFGEQPARGDAVRHRQVAARRGRPQPGAISWRLRCNGAALTLKSQYVYCKYFGVTHEVL